MKPTAAQANMLKTLEGDVRIVATVYRDGELRDPAAYTKNGSGTTNYKSLAAATFQSLVRHGWVVRTDEEKGSFSGVFRISELGCAALAELQASDFIPARPPITAGRILDLLRQKYEPPEWVFFPELRFGTGFDGSSDQRIDAWAMNTYRSQGFVTVAFEIKVYRSDWLKELKKPAKRQPAMSVSNEFYFVSPKHLIARSEVPDDCGLMWVSDGRITTIRKPPARKINNPGWCFMASLARRIGSAERKESP